MYYLKFVRMAAEGVRRMKTEMAGMALPQPEFAQKGEAYTLVRVTLRNNIKQRKVWVDSDIAQFLGKHVETLLSSLSEEQKRCLNYIAEYGSINVSHAARITGRDWATVNRMMRQLVEMDILRREARTDIDRDPQARFVLARPKGTLSGS